MQKIIVMGANNSVVLSDRLEKVSVIVGRIPCVGEHIFLPGMISAYEVVQVIHGVDQETGSVATIHVK